MVIFRRLLLGALSTPCFISSRMLAGESTPVVQVHMEVGSAVVACVALVGAGQPGAARVALFAAEEGSAAIDAWGTSPHIVFQ